MELLLEDVEKILLAVAMGGIIGLEREWRGKSAGFRTMMLVTLGSTLFTMMSYKLSCFGSGCGGDRIASNIVTGIGFLGAGLIFKDEKTVRGLTTAATVWAAAAVGIAIGGGHFLMAGITTAIIWAILVVLHMAEVRFEKMLETREYIIRYNHVEGEEYLAYNEFFDEKGFKLMYSKMEKTDDVIIATWSVRGAQKKHDEMVKKMIEDKRIRELDY
jgi:Uncharacterized membrane protein